MKKIIFFSLLSVILCSSCEKMIDSFMEGYNSALNKNKKDADLKTININNYSIGVAKSMDENKKLSAGASLQYANLFKEEYIIVLDEKISTIDSVFSLSETLDDYKDSTLFGTYTNLMMASYASKIESSEPKHIVDVVINGLPGKQMSRTGTVKDIGIYYKVTLLKGKNHFYQIYTWTLDKKKDELDPIMNEMTNSFKEVNKAAI